MTENTTKNEDAICHNFINEFGGIIKGVTTPQEMAEYVQEYVVENTGLINLDYQDALATLRGVKEGDGMVIQSEKDNLQSTLEECETKLKNAHPNMTMTKLLLQIIVPQQSILMMDDIQMLGDYISSLGDNLQTVWGIASRNDDSGKYKLFIMVGFND
jgi:hypothetical protein